MTLLQAPSGAAGPFARRGEQHRRAGRYTDASAEFERALQRNPRDVWLLARRASVQTLLAAREQRSRTVNALDLAVLESRYRPMLDAFECALEVDANDVWTHCQRVEVLRCMKRHEACLAACSRVLELKPGFAWAYRRRAWAQRWLLRFDDALTDIDEALRLEPHEHSARGYRALLKGMMSRLSEALEDFDAVMMTGAQTTLAWSLERGFILALRGRPADAIPWLERSLSRDDSHLAQYMLLVAKHLSTGTVEELAMNHVSELADCLLAQESWPIGELMRAGVCVLKNDRRGAVAGLLRISVRGDPTLVEAVLCDPLTQRVVSDSSELATVLSRRLEGNQQAYRYLVPPALRSLLTS